MTLESFVRILAALVGAGILASILLAVLIFWLMFLVDSTMELYEKIRGRFPR